MGLWDLSGEQSKHSRSQGMSSAMCINKSTLGLGAWRGSASSGCAFTACGPLEKGSTLGVRGCQLALPCLACAGSEFGNAARLFVTREVKEDNCPCGEDGRWMAGIFL